MNILQIVQKLDQTDKARDVVDTTRFLTLNGHKSVVVSEESKPRPCAQGEGRGKLIREIDEVGARHYSIPLKPNIFLIPIAVFKLSQVILKENIQVVHARDPLSSFIAFFATRFIPSLLGGDGFRNRVFITTIYGDYKKSFFGNFQGWAKRVICFTENQARYLVKEGFVSQNKVSVIPPFVRAGTGRQGQVFQRRISSQRHLSLHGHPPRGFVIGAALPLFSFELTQNFIRAVLILSRAIPNLKVFVVDSAPAYAKDSIEKLKLLIKRYFLNNVITFLSSEESQQFLNGLDLLVQINPAPADRVRVKMDENPTLGLLLQGAAHDIPVVTTYVDWIRNYVEDDKKPFLVCRDNTPKDLANTILNLYRDEKLRNEVVNKARKCVKEKFNIKKVMESTLKVYQDTLSKRSILIIKIGALGDAILAVPSVRAIRKKFPKSKVKLLVGIDNREVFMNSPFIDEIIGCDFKERDRSLAGFLRIAKNLRNESFDIVVDLQNNKKSHLLSFLSGAAERYGYDNGKLSFLLNKKVKDRKAPLDPIEHQSKVLDLLGIHNVDKKLELWPSKEDEKWADNFLKSHWVNPGLTQPVGAKSLSLVKSGRKQKGKLVAFNIGSSPKWITKLWPVEYFAEVCNKLAKNFGIRIMLIGLEKESPRIKEFLKRAKCKPINALNKTNIPRLASLVKRCNLVVSSDSAPIHITAAVGRPFVALFGPTDPARHLPPAEKNYKIFKKDLKCSPCYRSYCNKGFICMRSIKPNEVYEAILELLHIKQ